MTQEDEDEEIIVTVHPEDKPPKRIKNTNLYVGVKISKGSSEMGSFHFQMGSMRIGMK